MSNLKKVLALVMVLALSLSMVISAGAAFSDVSASDPNATAYALLADLKIAQGYDDGTFQPNTNLTRETAVTFIFRMATGQANADYMKGATKFPDVAADRWSSGYINWAAEKGIVAGDPDGKFVPGRAVTLAELSKMMVVAMGYDAKNYNFPWGFVDKAQDLGLFSGVSNENALAPTTRGITSVVIKNGLLCTGRVEIVGTTVTPLSTSFAETRFNIKKNEANRLIGTSNLVGASTISNALNTIELSVAGKYTFSGNVDALFGRNVTVWYKDADADGTLDPAETIVSVTAKGGDTVVSVAAASISSNKATINGKEYSFPAANLNSVNFDGAADISATYGTNVNTTVYGVDDNNDGTFEYSWAVAPIVTKISNITTLGAVSSSAVGGDAVLTNVPKEQIKAYDGIAKNDIVYASSAKTVYKNASGAVTTGTVYTLAKASIVSGVQVTSVSGSSYTIGGTAYKLAAGVGAPALGSTVDLVLSPTGFVKSTTAVTAATTTVYGVALNATATFGADGTYKDRVVSVLKGDGTSAAYAVTDNATIDGAYVDATKNWSGNPLDIIRQAVALTVNADGKVTAIAPITAATAGDTLAYSKTTGIATVDHTASADTSYTIGADSVIFYIQTGQAVKAYKGAAIPTFSATALSHIQASGTLNTITVAVISAPLSATTTDSNAFIQYLRADYENGATAYKYKVAYSGEVKEYSSSKAPAAAASGALSTTVSVTTTPQYLQISLNSDGTLASVAAASGTAFTADKTVEAITGSVVKFSGDTTLYTIKSDAKILVMDVKGNPSATPPVAYTFSAPNAFGTVADNVKADSVVDYIYDGTYITYIVVYNDID